MDLTVDRHAFSVTARTEATPDRDFWLAPPVGARVHAIEAQHQIIYGPASTAARLQRVLEIVSLEDLKRDKRAAGRHQDLADLEHLP
jgi:hypothetical protein